MKQYVLLTESGSDLSPELAMEYGIRLVPMYVQLNGKTYADGDISSAEMFDFCNSNGVIPTTSAPNPADFELVYHHIRSKNPDSIIIHIAYSAQTTCSYQNSIIADDGYENIYHVDSEHVSAGLGAVVIQSARYLMAHPDVEPAELVEKIMEISKQMKFHFVVQDMRYLKAGGRCSNTQYLMALIFSIKPLIEMRNGLLVAARRYRGKMELVCEKVVEDFFNSTEIETDEIYLAYSHGLTEEIRTRIEQKCRSHQVNRILWSITGCIISTHGGPGGFAIGGLAKR
ncbi:DegV family protein [Paenibacillus tritici]|uniref:DegV family protein n=1 Tax=Paenibacillus tritici TaxID=1873425 RepID=UPI001BA929D9|nr:DegV family protein [Paenibacillus tritici]QUL53427.1 DegV family protein [Paenibacillus tritici]